MCECLVSPHPLVCQLNRGSLCSHKCILSGMNKMLNNLVACVATLSICCFDARCRLNCGLRHFNTSPNVLKCAYAVIICSNPTFTFKIYVRVFIFTNFPVFPHECVCVCVLSLTFNWNMCQFDRVFIARTVENIKHKIRCLSFVFRRIFFDCAWICGVSIFRSTCMHVDDVSCQMRNSCSAKFNSVSLLA